MPTPNPTPAQVICECGHPASEHNRFVGCSGDSTHKGEYTCKCLLEEDQVAIQQAERLASRVAELEAQLDTHARTYHHCEHPVGKFEDCDYVECIDARRLLRKGK